MKKVYATDSEEIFKVSKTIYKIQLVQVSKIENFTLLKRKRKMNKFCENFYLRDDKNNELIMSLETCNFVTKWFSGTQILKVQMDNNYRKQGLVKKVYKTLTENGYKIGCLTSIRVLDRIQKIEIFFLEIEVC